jgi:probable F420-dependent oxidoreductase
MTRPTLSIGVSNFGPWAGGDWRGLVDLARAAEDAGVDRLIVNDHVVMGRNTDKYVWGRFPTPPEGPWLEPVAVMTAMATVTSRIRLSTGILIAPLRPAALLAKQIATLDVLSGGRIDLGVGVGWQKEEYDAQQLDFSARGQLLEDTIGACRALWEQLPASYSSPSLSFDDVFCSPQPVQERLPVWFSGTLNDRNLRRVVDLGDGWIPIMGASLDDVRLGAERIRAQASRPITVQGRAPLAMNSDGKPDPVATMASVPDWVAAGADDISIHVVPFAPSMSDALAAFGKLAKAFRAAVG